MKRFLRWAYGKIPLKKHILSCVRALWSPPQTLYRHLHFKGAFEVPVGEGRAFLINHHGYEVENEIFWKGLRQGWEPVSMSLWIELCKKSRCILDVGANTGIFALAAKAINPAAQVYAFEPVERIFDKLVANCALNGGSIHCIKTAASNFNGKATIFEGLSEHLYSVTVNRNLSRGGVPTVKVEIDTTRLDTFLDSLGGSSGVDLIKLDVETHEPEVLEGLGEYLNRNRPTMLIEVLSSEAASRIEGILKGMEYLYFDIDEIGVPIRRPNLTKSAHFNFLICSEFEARNLRLM